MKHKFIKFVPILIVSLLAWHLAGLLPDLNKFELRSGTLGNGPGVHESALSDVLRPVAAGEYTAETADTFDGVAQRLLDKFMDKIQSRDKSQAFLIWFFGPSGGGKSHLARKVAKLLKGQGLRVSDSSDAVALDAYTKRALVDQYDVVIQETTFAELSADQRACVDIAVRLMASDERRFMNLSSDGLRDRPLRDMILRGTVVDQHPRDWQHPAAIVDADRGLVDGFAGMIIGGALSDDPDWQAPDYVVYANGAIRSSRQYQYRRAGSGIDPGRSI